MRRMPPESVPDLWEETRRLVGQIPEGMVSTYGRIAEALGDVRASRFVSSAIETLVMDASWRVVRADGTLGTRPVSGANSEERSRWLGDEGVRVKEHRVVDLDNHVFADFKSPRPLARLRQEQLRTRRGLMIPSDDIAIERVAGMDVAYEGDSAWAAMVVVDFETGAVVRSECIDSKAFFPYVPSYLAFRELPLVEPLTSGFDESTVLMYDGNGILHPEGFGIASHAGVLFDVPTIGVAKRLLCGNVSRDVGPGVASVEVDGRVAGYAISAGQRMPVYVSPGHAIGHTQTSTVVRRLLKHRIPEPIRMAHALAARERRSATNK